ncbi:MAG TPA: PBP1A family penicillin-binding protein [Candidatus Acidoferrales bacterium]|nr:PBP1A family penicillin-binding protein [Candidatus Acidoferrales bacterium]
MKIRIARGFWTSRFGMALLGLALLAFVVATGILAFYYFQFGHLIDQRLTGQVFQNASRVFSSPGQIYVGEEMKPQELVTYLLHAGYQESKSPGAPGVFRVSGSSIEIKPSDDSYFHGGNSLRVQFEGSEISHIAQLPTGGEKDWAEVEPELITNLFDETREKRRVVQFADLPKDMVNAVLAAEDKRFYDHGALDLIRVVGAALRDVSKGEKAQGASTIDMQVARTFFFSTKREWSRKAKEVLMAYELDERFSKHQIFELYANDIYLGNRGSFAIRGFGEAAQAYFGKDIHELTLGEEAFLAGIIRAPNRYSSAERHPDRAVEARDRVLAQMVEDGFVTQDQANAAKKSKLHFINGGVESSTAPYFVDMVKDHLLEKFSESDLETQSYRIYTTLDPDLQQAASEAVQLGMQNVDKLLARRYALWKKKGETVPQAQVALVAMDPHTGEIRALVGGRDYGESQLNHALARRQPGSVFKPFVYAAAFENGLLGFQPVVTPVTTVDDVPTTFEFDGKEYTPNNYGEEFFGTVTVHDALMHSLNVATVKVAQMIGYDRVADLAHEMGLGANIQPTPAVALGAYEMTPIDVAAGYTAFATNGTRVEPLFIRSVVGADDKVDESNETKSRPVLDPRVAFLTTTMMEDVINHGTGEAVRELGFTAPAAGKTGTSRDGWFSGFTSNLLCVVWVGFDDNRDIGLTGGASAAPIWAEFMKRAVMLPTYRDTQPFQAPAGIVEEQVDPQTGGVATPSCPQSAEEYFISGTEPTQYCQAHGGQQGQQPSSWLAHLFGKDEKPPTPPPAVPVNPGAVPLTPSNVPPSKALPGQTPAPPPAAQPAPDAEKKKGLLDKIFGIFGSGKKPEDDKKPQPQ